MKITVCHKSGACTNLTADDYCHIEVDGVIVWYPEVDDRAPKSSEVANDSASPNTEREEICPFCAGTGNENHWVGAGKEKPCNHCHGEGKRSPVS